MKILKFLLRQIFRLLLILVSIALVIWLLWNLIRQIDFNIFRKEAQPSAVLTLKSGTPQQLSRNLGGASGAEQSSRASGPDALQKHSSGETAGTSVVHKAPASSAVPESFARDTSGKEQENIVLITAKECKINGRTVRNKEFGAFLDFLTKVDKKTKVCFYPGHPADVYELIKSIDNKHISIFIDYR